MFQSPFQTDLPFARDETMTQDAPDSNPTGETHEPANTAALGLFALGVLVFAFALLVLLPFVTSGPPAGKSWFLSPRNAPLAAIIVMGLGTGLLVAQFFRTWLMASDRRAFWTETMKGFEGNGEALTYSALFALYVAGLGFLGFAISTLIFGQVCLWLAGLRSLRWSLWNLAFTVVLVVVLRVIMGLWFPMAPIFAFTPSWFANTIGPYL